MVLETKSQYPEILLQLKKLLMHLLLVKFQFQ